MFAKESHWMRRFEVLMAVCGLLGIAACGHVDALPNRLPYDPNSTAVIGGKYDNPDGTAGLIETTPDGEACINLDDVCVQPQKECGDTGAADVLLDDQGAVADVICYPTSGVAIEDFEGDVRNVGNDVVLVLDGVDDGADVVGDVTIDGNNVTLYGHGPDTSVIDGDLNIEKNNSVVRGVRVTGDVTIEKNNPSLVDCVIEGDLTIKGNNVSIALCDVWGKLIVEGNNAVLVSNHFASAPEVHGNNTVCSANRLFTDADADKHVSEDELGDTVDCTGKAKAK
jgi:hypothetical protein